MKRKRKPLRDKFGRFKKRFVPKRDKFGRFKKRFVPKRDKLGRFKKIRPAKKRPAKKRPAKPYKHKFHEPRFNLCHAADRQDFYDSIIEERKKLRDKLSEEDYSAIRVEIDIIGKVKKRKTKKGKVSKRRRTAFIGDRSFSDMRKLKRFLLLDTGHKSGVSDDNPFGLDWSKKALCQYDKEARIVLPSERRRGKFKTLKTFKLGE